MDRFVIVKDALRNIRKFGLKGRTIEFKLRPVPADVDPVGWVKSAIEEVVLKGVENVEPTDQVGFTFCSKDFVRGQGWMHFRPAANVTVEDIWEKISSIYQSNSAGLNTETFCLGVTTVKMPSGRGRGINYSTFEEACNKQRGIVNIKNTDNLCLPRALVVAIANVTKDSLWKKIRQDTGKIQTQRALHMLKEADVSIPKEGAGIEELKQLQQYLSEYKIVVYTYGNKGRDTLFEGESEGPNLNLIYHKDHFNVITSLTAAFCCHYFCESCHVPYDHKNDHRCEGTCTACIQSPACLTNSAKIFCEDCKREFKGQNCYANHKAPTSYKKSTVCKEVHRCLNCFKVVKTDREHFCGEVFCKICQKHVPQDHLCYIQRDTRYPKKKDLLFVFYDLETRQEKEMADGIRLHEPNLCVFKQACSECIDNTDVICQRCGLRLQVLKSNDVISPFLHHILGMRKKFKNVVVLAHNGGGYDNQFILNYILEKTDLTPEIIMRGTKLILLNIGENLKFIDSLNYFPMALSALPKAFGLTGIKKGYFPHLFNTLENQEYEGPIPAQEYYDPDNMKAEEREKFLIWHSERIAENYIFDFKKELVEYCKSDVEILTAACLKFRNQLLETTNVCPFTEATTIASACNKVFRRNFLAPNSIGIIPKGGYRFRDNQSAVALQWLLWEGHQRNIRIQHVGNGIEVRANGVKVDGFCSDTNQVFEFQGCLFHGCRQCFTTGRTTPLSEEFDTLDARWKRTVSKNEHLKSKGYEVVEMWQCDFEKEKKNNPEIEEYVLPHLDSIPLNPRDAFYGGRTGNMVEYYKVKGKEQIRYVDVCSLYPWVCKYGKFPIGHPKKIHVGEECKDVQISDMSGCIKCKILPPKDLLHPVLPQKINNKLLFTLCSTCGKNNIKECYHSDKERALTGTWIIEEVVKALEKGYTMIEIYEIWEYNTLQLNKNVVGLFSKMMDKFIKIKQEASGWPKHCITETQKNEYILEFLEREDIKLDSKQIVENSGLRSLAKLMLNSFWGKFGQRENQSKTSVIRTTAEFFELMTCPKKLVNTILPINHETIIVNWEFTDEGFDNLSTVNVIIAAYVTTLARLKLYSYLEILDRACLYVDTDSALYISRPNFPEISTGSCIGDMTDELERYGSGSYITEFVSGGPKNYAYKVFSPTTNKEYICCKVKGISLNYNASKIVNFEKIKEMVLTHSEPVSVLSRQIKRTKTHEIVTVYSPKIYRLNSTKRIFSEDGTSSVPFGYKRHKTD